MAKRVRRARSKAENDARRSAKAAEDAKAEQRKADAAAPEQQRLREFLNAFGGSASREIADAISQMLVVTVGSVPSIAVANSMLAANAAEGAMYFNAVANQQKTNLLGMAMTASCVRYMLEGGRHSAQPDLDDLLGDIAGEGAAEQ